MAPRNLPAGGYVRVVIRVCRECEDDDARRAGVPFQHVHLPTYELCDPQGPKKVPLGQYLASEPATVEVWVPRECVDDQGVLSVELLASYYEGAGVDAAECVRCCRVGDGDA